MNDAHAFVYLDNGMYVVVDADLYDGLMSYEWKAHHRRRCWYAYTEIVGPKRTFKLFMHRLIARTPADQVTHHKNNNGLDNRRCNLENMTRHDHKVYHINNPRIIKYLPMPEYV